MKIVIVDDDEAMRKLLRAICEGEEHTVVAQFPDGQGLLDFVRNERPDVVCLDYELPGKNGFELLAEMDAVANQVAVVMITGSSEPELQGHAADLGAALKTIKIHRGRMMEKMGAGSVAELVRQADRAGIRKS